VKDEAFIVKGSRFLLKSRVLLRRTRALLREDLVIEGDKPSFKLIRAPLYVKRWPFIVIVACFLAIGGKAQQIFRRNQRCFQWEQRVTPCEH